MIHQSPPPGYITAPWLDLEMSRQNFYQSGLNTLWDESEFDAYRAAPNTPTLYAAGDVSKLRHWLFTRRGLIALGALAVGAPLKPDFNLAAWFDEGHHDSECPECRGPAIVDRWDAAGRVWCPEHGVMPLD